MRRKMTAVLVILMLLATAVVFLGACGQKDEGITSLDQLNRQDIKIGVATDTTEFEIVEKDFPEAEVVYFKDLMFAFTSVSQGKIDAFFCNKLNMELAIHNGLTGVRILDETVGDGNVGAVAISPVTKIPDLKDQINKFLGEITDDGTLEEIRERWLVKRDMVMPDFWSL